MFFLENIKKAQILRFQAANWRRWGSDTNEQSEKVNETWWSIILGILKPKWKCNPKEWNTKSEYK